MLYGILADSENSFRLATAAVEYYEEHYKKTDYIGSMEAELRDTQKALDNLVKAIEMGIFSETTQNRLTELEARKRGLQDAIEAERVRSELMQDAHSIEAYFKRYSEPDMFDDDIRDEVLEYFVDKIFVYDDRIIVTGPYFEGIAEQVSFEELADDSIEFDSFAVGSTHYAKSGLSWVRIFYAPHTCFAHSLHRFSEQVRMNGLMSAPLWRYLRRI